MLKYIFLYRKSIPPSIYYYIIYLEKIKLIYNYIKLE